MGKTLRNLLVGGLAVIVGALSAKYGLDHYRQKKFQEQMFLDTVAEYVDIKSRIWAGDDDSRLKSSDVDHRLNGLDNVVWDDLNFFTDDNTKRAEAFEKRGYVCFVMNSVNVDNAREYVYGRIVGRDAGEYNGKKYDVIMFETFEDSIDTILYKKSEGNVRTGFIKDNTIYLNLTVMELLAERFYEEGKELKNMQLKNMPSALYDVAALKYYDDIMDKIKDKEGNKKKQFVKEFIEQRIKINKVHEREHLFSDDEIRAYIAQLSEMPTHYDLQFILRLYPEIGEMIHRRGFSDERILLANKEEIRKLCEDIYDIKYSLK